MIQTNLPTIKYTAGMATYWIYENANGCVFCGLTRKEAHYNALNKISINATQIPINFFFTTNKKIRIKVINKQKLNFFSREFLLFYKLYSFEFFNITGIILLNKNRMPFIIGTTETKPEIALIECIKYLCVFHYNTGFSEDILMPIKTTPDKTLLLWFKNKLELE